MQITVNSIKKKETGRDITESHYFLEFYTGMPISNVCLKWVSAEDGSHILTVALGTYIFLYTQVSQGAAQRNIVMMKEHDTHRRGPLRKTSSLANPETISTRLVGFIRRFVIGEELHVSIIVFACRIF